MVKNVPAETISIPEFMPWRSKKRSIESSDNLSLVMKLAHIDQGSQPSATVAYTFPNSVLTAESSTSMSLANDVNQNHMKESLKSTRILSISNNIKKKPNVSSKNDPTKERCLEIDESVIELDKLFVCKECGKYSVEFFLIFNKYEFTQLKCFSCRYHLLKWRNILYSPKSLSLLGYLGRKKMCVLYESI